MLKSKYPLTFEEFKSIYSKVPRLTVELLVQTEEGILLTKRAIDPYKGCWHIPGGTVYYKETLEDALKRVAKNELGVEVEVEKFMGFIYYPNLIPDQGFDWPVGSAYLAKITGGKPSNSDQGEEVRFFRNIPENMVPSQGEFLLLHDLIER